MSDYPWNEQALPIVDVGGGIGSLEMALLKTKEHANLDFIIFDIDTTVANGKKVGRIFFEATYLTNSKEDLGRSSGRNIIAYYISAR